MNIGIGRPDGRKHIEEAAAGGSNDPAESRACTTASAAADDAKDDLGTFLSNNARVSLALLGAVWISSICAFFGAAVS